MEILFASILRVLHHSLATEFLPHFSYGLRLFSHVFTDSRKDMHYNNVQSWVFGWRKIRIIYIVSNISLQTGVWHTAHNRCSRI